MKNMKIYLAIFAISLVLNASLAAKIKKTTQGPGGPDAPPQEIPSNTTNGTLPNLELPEVARALGVGPIFGTAPPPPPATTTTEVIPVFTKLDNTLCFSDVGVSSEGIIVGAGLDGVVYEYAFAEEAFHALVPDYQVSNIWRLDINYDGIIYVITRCGDTYYLDCEKRWVKLPGCAIDIGAGRSGEIYKIGCEESSTCSAPNLPCNGERKSPYVYKLICSCNCKCCDRRCKVFLKKYEYKTCEPAEKRICYWIKLPLLIRENGNFVEFTRIDVKNTGFPITTNGSKNVYEFKGGDVNEWESIYFGNNRGPILDVASDNEGNDFFSDSNGSYIITGATSATEITTTLFPNGKGASDLSAGPYGIISFIEKTTSSLFTTAKQNYN